MGAYAQKIILFSEEYYKGKALVVFDKIDCFSTRLPAWNDMAQSIIVIKGTWSIKANCIGLGGEFERLVYFYDDGESKGFYPNFEPIIDKKVSALEPVSRPCPPIIHA